MNNLKEQIQTIRDTNAERVNHVFTLAQREQRITFDIRAGADTKYPSIYLRYAITNSNSKDRLKSIIKSEGCRNLTTGVAGVYNDVEHNDFFSGRKDKIVSRNAGQVTEIELIDGILYGTSRVGKEHNILDKKGNVTGSSYANAWLTVAQDKIRTIGGDVQDYIPSHIWQEFFVGKNPVPYKNVSVEMSYDNYDDQNAIRFDGVELINTWDMVRVSFLTDSVAGQQDSAFVSYDIRSIQKKLNNPNMENLIKIAIRCLCNSKVGDMVMDNATGLIYELLAINNDGTYSVKSVDDGTEMTVTKAEAENFDNVDDTIRKIELSPQTRAYIRMCMACKGKKVKRDGEDEVKTDVIIPNEIRADSPLTQTAPDEITLLKKEIEGLKSLITDFIDSQKTIGNAVRSIEDQETINDVSDVILTDDTKKDDVNPKIIDDVSDVVVTDDTKLDDVTDDVSSDVTDIADEVNNALRAYKPFDFSQKNKPSTGFKKYTN
jgi:hypothetical protein